MNWNLKENKHLPPQIIFMFAVLAVFFALLLVLQTAADRETANGISENVVGAEDLHDRRPEANVVQPIGNSNQKMVPLQEDIQRIIGEAEGDWAVTVINLSDETRFSIESKRMYAASLIKLYIMGAVFQAIEDGRLEYTSDVENYLYYMITVSDNPSSDWLVVNALGNGDPYEGIAAVNAFAVSKGWSDTEQGQLFDEMWYSNDDLQAFTSSNDCAEFLEAIYRGQCVSPEKDALMLEILKAQVVTLKIPMGLPEGVPTANKTGDLWNVENDAAIVFSPAGDYVLCVMSNNIADSDSAIETIIQISAATYAYFNPPAA
jgi:beta-lactamase class A